MDNIGVNLRAFLSNAGTDEELGKIIAHFADSAKYISLQIQDSIREKLETWNMHEDVQMKLKELNYTSFNLYSKYDNPCS